MKFLFHVRTVIFFLFLIYCFPLQGICGIDHIKISSPDGRINLVITIRDEHLEYSINYNNISVIEPSVLGMIIKGRNGTSSVIFNVGRYSVNKAYPFRGVHATAINKYNEAMIGVNTREGYFIDARVFNDGVAFCYIYPHNDNDSVIIEGDNTEFVIPHGSITWSQSNIKYYEGKYGKRNIEDFKEGDLAGPPLTFQTANGKCFAAITEGGLTDFGGMSLIYKKDRTFQSNLSGITRKKVQIITPWRIIEIGKDLNTLVNCDIISNVSRAYNPRLFPQGYNTNWIKPGRSVWSWLAERGPVTLENMKKFTDLAALLGFEYNLVDEGWSNWKDSINHRDQWDMMKELVDYSTAKGVKIWVWKAYPDRKGIPGIKDSSKRLEFFKKCKDLGIVGLKVDFFNSEDQPIIEFYQAALKDAATYHLMMDFHGANKPTGETRTWPNEMSREGIRGLENRPPWAQTNTIVPFTRYLAGHADFTPVNFRGRLGEVSWAHQVATMIVFTSPFLCLGADPQDILNNPAKEMMQSIPTTWDETIVLPQSKIGELVLFARRKDDRWFLAAMNGIHEQRTISVDLSFLKKGTYKLSSMKDDKDKQANAIIESSKLSSKSTFTIILNPEGGYVGRFDKVKK